MARKWNRSSPWGLQRSGRSMGGFISSEVARSPGGQHWSPAELRVYHGLARLARKFGQAILPVRISVFGGAVSLEESGRSSLRRDASRPDSGQISTPRLMLDLEFVERTDNGRVRDHNEDYLGYAAPASPAQVRSHGWLFALADGVGGQEKGEVASRAAIESMLAGFRGSAGGESHTALLPRLVQKANAHVFETAVAGGRASAGMATTIVACALRFDRVAVAVACRFL